MHAPGLITIGQFTALRSLDLHLRRTGPQLEINVLGGAFFNARYHTDRIETGLQIERLICAHILIDRVLATFEDRTQVIDRRLKHLRHSRKRGLTAKPGLQLPGQYHPIILLVHAVNPNGLSKPTRPVTQPNEKYNGSQRELLGYSASACQA